MSLPIVVAEGYRRLGSTIAMMIAGVLYCFRYAFHHISDCLLTTLSLRALRKGTCSIPSRS